MSSLFAVYLGGRAPRCNTELHDVVFTIGDSLKDCKNQLVEKWFGDPTKIHVDSWIQMKVIDKHTVEIKKEAAPANSPKLYFVNLGAYKQGLFTEIHENVFLVCQDANEAKKRAKQKLCEGMDQVHTDDLFDVDDLIELSEIDGHHVHLTATGAPDDAVPHNAYLQLEKIK